MQDPPSISTSLLAGPLMGSFFSPEANDFFTFQIYMAAVNNY
jgi:hypothetical protein